RSILPIMQELESVDGTSYSLTLSLVGESVVDFGLELREAKGAIMRWKKARRDRCAGVQFHVAAPTNDHAEIQRLLERVHKDEAEPGPFLRDRRTEVVFLNAKGKRVREVVLGDVSQAVTAAPPPEAARSGSSPDDEEGGGTYGLMAQAETL